MICISCGVDKDTMGFEHQKNRPNPRKVCKACRYKSRNREAEKARHRAYHKERRRAYPDLVRQQWERSVYGVSKEDIGATSCMICGKDSDLCIDHCHTEGIVRGILCGKCNRALGLFADDPLRLIKAASYLIAPPHKNP